MLQDSQDSVNCLAVGIPWPQFTAKSETTPKFNFGCILLQKQTAAVQWQSHRFGRPNVAGKMKLIAGCVFL